MTRMVTYAGLDVRARSTHAAAIDVSTGELLRARFGPGIEEPLAWLQGLPGPVRACYEAGPTGSSGGIGFRPRRTRASACLWETAARCALCHRLGTAVAGLGCCGDHASAQNRNSCWPIWQSKSAFGRPLPVPSVPHLNPSCMKRPSPAPNFVVSVSAMIVLAAEQVM
jgi:hypothetical protein